MVDIRNVQWDAGVCGVNVWCDDINDSYDYNNN